MSDVGLWIVKNGQPEWHEKRDQVGFQIPKMNEAKQPKHGSTTPAHPPASA